jgi:threonine dehydrogenase-like Zn-dependent dehydrogenase
LGVDLVPERLEMARRHGIEVLNLEEHDDIVAAIRELTDGRGPDSVIDAVGMEAHGAPATRAAPPIPLAQKQSNERHPRTGGNLPILG